MTDILAISQCNIAQIIGESNRFLFHVLLVHISTCIIEGKPNFFSEELFRTLLITAMAITMYHVFFRKIMDPKIEKMKLICYNQKKRIKNKELLDKQDPLRSKPRARRNESKRNKRSNDRSSRGYSTR